MATLKDVVGKLEENNQKLGNIDTSIDKVEAGILGLFGLQKRSQLDQLEASREAGQSAKNVATLGNEPKGKGAGGDSDNDGGGLFSGLAAGATGLLGGLTLSGLLRGLIKRSPFLLATVFGDELASILEGLGLEKEIASSIGQGIQAAGIAGIISPRLAPIGFLLGTIIDEETASALKDIKDDFVANFDAQGLKDTFNKILEPINTVFDELGFDFNIDINKLTWKNVLGWLRTNLIEGAQSLSNILLGEGSVKDIGQAAGVLGAIAFAFAPFRTIALASKIPGVAFLLGKKLLSAVKTLGGLALGLGDAAASVPLKQSGGTSLAYKAGQQVGRAGNLLRIVGGSLAFVGGGPIIGIAAVTAAAAYAFTQTGMYADLKKKSEDILASMPLGADTDESALLTAPNRSPANAEKTVGPQDTTRLAYLQGRLRLPNLGEGEKAVIENEIKALRIKMGLEKPPASNSLTDAILADQTRRQQSQTSNFVDASQTNVAPQTTAFVGSGANSFDMNNPILQRAMAGMGM